MSPSTTCLTCGRLIRRGQSYCHEHRPRNGSTRQWRELRQQILGRDRWTCQLCGAAAEHVDHIRPLINGGSDHPGNLRATCAECNLRNGSRGAQITSSADARTPRQSTASEAARATGGSPDGR